MRVWIALIIAGMLAWAEGNKSAYFKVLMERQNPYVFDKSQRLELQKERLKAQTTQKVAEYEYKKAVDVQKIKKEQTQIKSQSEIKKEEVAITPQKQMVEVKKRMLLYALLGFLLFLILAYLAFKRYQAYKEKIELEKMRLQEALHEKEMAMRERELQAQIAGKLIDAVASGNLSKEQEEKLLGLANGNNLLENKQ